MQKARCHPKGLQQFVSVWFQDLFHSLVQGSFHLSLTVLVHYRSLRSIQPYRMVPANSCKVSRAPHYSGYHYLHSLYLYRAVTVYGQAFQLVLVHTMSNVVVLQPHNVRKRYGLGYCAFARRYQRNHYCFLFLRVLRCFSSPGLPPCGYYTFSIVGCPIRISADRFVCANPRSFSQLITSFFASESLGIPHTPLKSLCLLPNLLFTISSKLI